MRNLLTSALLAGLFLTACGKEKEDPPADNSITAEQRDALGVMRQAQRSKVLTCSDGIMCGADGDGDSALFAGLMCHSGDAVQCAAVHRAQCEDGRPCRSVAAQERIANSASRDMLLGHLHAMVMTKNTVAATRLLGYIESHGNQLCTDADDNRCDLNPTQYTAMWGTLKKVWVYLGLTPTTNMNLGDTGDEGLIKLQSMFSGSGYPRHLVGVTLMLRQKTGNWYNVLQDAANNLASLEPENPFFELVARGRTQRAAELTLKYCSTSPVGDADEWSWQRAFADMPYQHSMGWDCIFMANELLGE